MSQNKRATYEYTAFFSVAGITFNLALPTTIVSGTSITVSYSKMYGTEPRYNEQISPVPWHFVNSRLNCIVYYSDRLAVKLPVKCGDTQIDYTFLKDIIIGVVIDNNLPWIEQLERVHKSCDACF